MIQKIREKQKNNKIFNENFILIFLTVLLLFILYSCISQFNQQQFSNRYEESSKKIELARNLIMDFSECQKNMIQYLRTGNEIYRGDYYTAISDIESNLMQAKKIMNGENTRFLMPSIQYMNTYYARTCISALEAYQNEDYSYYTSMSEMEKIYNYLKSYCEQLLQASMEESMQHYDLWEAARKKMIPWNLLMILVLTAIFMGTIKLDEQRKKETFEKMLEQSRFLALQSQINPHFLFNTLNSIKSTILTEKYQQALTMIDSFAILMRYNLKSAQNTVTLKEELSITKEYMKIQKQRFGEHIQFHMQIDESLLDTVMLPRFTLQPLVENAIIHGIEKKIEAGYIIISAKVKNQNCIIRVFDNGVGMDRERLKEVLSQNYKGETHIGIGNIKKRLCIFTGREDCFKLRSKKNFGTMVRITIVKKEEG